jgi:hypothetical protein
MIQWGVNVDLEESEEGWPGVLADAVWPPHGSEDPNHTHGWPSAEGGIEVVVEVCSDALEHQRSHSTCRCL